MNKIKLIIIREYITRVRKKSFIIMSLLGPVLIALTFAIPVWLATMKGTGTKVIAIIDNPVNNFRKALQSSETIIFQIFDNQDINSLKQEFDKLNLYAILYNPDTINYSIDSIALASKNQPNVNVNSFINNSLSKFVESQRLKEAGIDEQVLAKIKANVYVNTIKWTADGKEKKSSTEIIMSIGFIGAILIYMFIFMYGSQVMRGVIEEKVNRIIEIIISSVKPFELMMGKILGISLVAVTQFVIWIVLSSTIILVLQLFISGSNSLITNNIQQTQISFQPDNISNQNLQNPEIAKIIGLFNSVPWLSIAINFIIFFIGGYLLYASFFAAIGSAVDNETETQQFMFPVAIPLFTALMAAQYIITNPDGPLSFWLSMFPLTSPVIMVIRIPFGVPLWENILSIAILIFSFIGSTWLAAKVFRTGILMYGKKVSYIELWKWLRYKN